MPRTTKTMSDHDGPGGQARGEARPAVLGDGPASPATSAIERDTSGPGARVPRGPSGVEKAGDVATPSSWRDQLRGFWRLLTGEPAATPGRTAPRAGDAPAPAPMSLRVGVVSTVGNYREHNEDNF